MEDNIDIRKTRNVEFKFKNVEEVKFVCENDKNLPVETNRKTTLQSDEERRQPAVQNIKEDILTPPTAVQFQNLKSKSQNTKERVLQESSLFWPHPSELSEE